MRARMGDIVRVHYEGMLDDGTVFATTIDLDPVEVTLGAGKVIAGFEEAIIGMRPGESRMFTIPEEEAFGPRQEELVQIVGREELALGLDPQIGERLEAIDLEGQTVRAIVRDISEQTITLDGNHDFAGQDLHFEVELVEIIGAQIPQ